MRRSLLAALALTLTAGLATSACESMAPGQALPGMTMWQLIEHSANPDGTMSLQASLVEFSYLFGPLPGVTMPTAKPDPPGFRVSGSGAVSAVINHWSELSDGQRQAIGAVLTPPPDPPKFRSEAQSPTKKANALIHQEVQTLIRDMSSRFGVTIPGATFSLVGSLEPSTRAYTVPLAYGERIEPGTRDKVFPKSGPTQQCLMFFPPSVWSPVADANGVPPEVRVTIAHELVHCFQAFAYPDIKLYHAAPRWLMDGGAEFAGIDIAQASDRPPVNNWSLYLTEDAPLFTRTYSAIGWWFQLQHVGRDPWVLMAQMWKAGVVDNHTAYVNLGGDSDDMYDTWAASRLREPGFGDSWDVHGTAVGPEKPNIILSPAQNGSIDVGEVDARPGELVTADLTGVIRVSAANPIRLHDSASYEEPHMTEGDYCLGETCTCPEKTERAGEEIRPVQGPLWLAVPGGEAGNSVRSDVVSLEDYCRKKEPERKKPDSHPQPRWARAHAPARNPHGPGSGSDGQPGAPKPASVGDPHLTTLDGYAFDFQTAGEFTLVRSDSGDLEVQTRQQPRIKFDGKESDIASMNTAAAARVAGDRVAFYAGQDRPEVRINGTITPVGNERKLPKGGTIRPVEAGYAVRWPDGTEMWVINAGAADSLTVLLGPADSRKGTLHGLLGPFVGKAGAMFSRDGHGYDKPSFDELYKKIGDSWRIKQSESLFDYQPGQSTETFTRKDLPTKPLTLADLSPEQRAAGEKACAGVTDELRERCVFDVAVSGNDKFAVGYRTLDKVSTVGGGTLTLNKRVGPQKLEPGQQQSFTISSDADALYFASDANCPASSSVYWRITMPDGKDTLQVPMCADPGRQTTTKKGTWKIDVWVAPGADQGGTFALHVAAAGPLRTFDIGLPKTVDGSVRGAGGEDRYKFNASAGDKVTITAKSPCDSDRSLDWGLESPDGNRITLRARACEGLGQQTIPTAGIWSVAVYNRTSDENPHSYAFLVSRP